MGTSSTVFSLLSAFLAVSVIIVIAQAAEIPNAAAAATPGSGTGTRFEALRACLTKNGVLPSQIVARDDANASAAYEDLNFQWNPLHGQLAPLAYLVASSATDVSTAVRCSVRARVRIVARSGGHSYLKYGFGDADSLVVDLQRMNQVTVDYRAMVATIGAGARGGKVSHDLWAAGDYLLPTGLCPTVGITGYTLGGGYGYYSRLYGLGADNLLGATVVDASGAIRLVNGRADPDLLWALRGGGGGNFGIVTSLTFKIHRAPNRIAFATATYDFESQFAPFFKSWQTFITSADCTNRVGTFLLFGGRRVEMELYSHSSGIGDPDPVEEALAILSTWFPPPTNLTIRGHTYPEFMLARAQYSAPSGVHLTEPAQVVNITRHNAVGFKKVKSMFVSRVLGTDEEVGHLQELLGDYLAAGNSFGIEHYGGAIKGRAPKDTAFVHRSALYEVQLQVFSREGAGAGESAESVRLRLEAMNRLFNETSRRRLWAHTESYQNYLDEDLPVSGDYLRRYYGDNLERLVAIKKKVDPGNVFWNPMSIPVAM